MPTESSSIDSFRKWLTTRLRLLQGPTDITYGLD